MKVLVIGANGFAGRGIGEALRGEHEVVSASRSGGGVAINMEDPASIAGVLQGVHPDAIVNCAGVVENNENAGKNPVFTRNLLQQAVASGLPLQRIVILGSAAEYGPVDSLPVDEDAPRRAASPYGLSKTEEVDTALRFRDEHNLPVVVARPFNPIGVGMAPRMLISGILRQIAAFRAGETDRIEVNRLDAKRDYLDISDVGLAIGVLLSGKPRHAVYNVGSGMSTTNRELIEAMVAEANLRGKPKLVETSDQPEPLFANQADISRITDEFGWRPKKRLADTIHDIMTA